MDKLSKIIECEKSYYQCFSKCLEMAVYRRFIDMELPDMYDHNFTYIKQQMPSSDLRKLIANELSISKKSGKDFCKVVMDYMPEMPLTVNGVKPQMSRMGYYELKVYDLARFSSNCDCRIKKVTTEDMVDDILFLDLIHDRDTLGADFCRRRAWRRGKVYLSNYGVNSYVCYKSVMPVGNVDLYFYDGVAKIEDFAVIPKAQRMGYGTAILKHVIEIVRIRGIHRIYLVTDEEDTAKEMYRKLGFEKIGERIEAFYRW